MLEKLRYDRKRLTEGICNLRENEREAHYAAYDFFVTAWHLADGWLNQKGMIGNDLISLLQEIANGVKHADTLQGKSEETHDEGDFSRDFSHDFDVDDLYLVMDDAAAVEAEDLGGALVGDSKISVSKLADKVLALIEEKVTS